MDPIPTAVDQQVPRIALIDANVLFAPRLRDLVIHLHLAQVINVHWTREIEDEWTKNVAAVLKVVDVCRQKLKQPPTDHERYVAILMRHRCKDLAHTLAGIWRVDAPREARNGSLFYAPQDSDKNAA